jgi:cbb3-type cytochrome oxidase subunit 3
MIAAADMRLYTLLLFFLIFTAVLVRIFVMARREDFAILARMPLGDETPHARSHARDDVLDDLREDVLDDAKEGKS